LGRKESSHSSKRRKNLIREKTKNKVSRYIYMIRHGVAF